MSSHRLPRLVGVALTAVALTAVAACGGGGGSDSGGDSSDSGAKGGLPKVEQVPAIADQVPAEIKKKGTLTVVMSTSSPPAHFETDTGMKGVDPDLAVVLGQVLGLKVKVEGVPLDQIIPGLQAKRYDVVLSQFSPTPERGKVVDFVNYAQSGTSLGVPGGNPKKLDVDTLCGVNVGVQKGSSQTVDVVPSLDKECESQGSEAVQMKTFRDSSAAMLALRSNRVDAVLLDTPVLGYAAKQSKGKVEAAGTIDPAPVSIGTVKDSGMDEPIQQALEHLKKDGAYDKVFARWGLEDTALDAGQFKINDIKE